MRKSPNLASTILGVILRAPARVAYSGRHPVQLAAGVRDPAIREDLTAFRVDAKNLLPARMVITTYNLHDGLLSPERLVFRQPKYRA